MKNSRICKIWASVVAVAGFAMGPACSHSVAAESGLINVARSQELQPESVWSDSLHAERMLPASRPEDDSVGALEDDEDVQRIASTVHRWRADGEVGANEAYADMPGFCRAVKLAEIAEHGHVLTPGRYVGAEATDDDDEAFNDKMERLTAQLAEQMAQGAELDAVIREKLASLGYAI